MTSCDTCAHFILLAGQGTDRRGWCNGPLPEWIASVSMQLGRKASMVKASDGKECDVWKDADP